jgi:peptidoglycan/LPS O-acetylase OafA/YrhL
MIGKHIPALDGIRGCAAVLVVLSHLARVGLTDTTPQFSGPRWSSPIFRSQRFSDGPSLPVETNG